MIKFRRAETKDIPALVEARKRQLIDEGAEALTSIDEELKEYLRKMMASDMFIQWIAEDDDKLAATGAIIFTEFPPGYSNVSGEKGYVASMYTVPEYRNQGLASRILERLENEAKARQIHRLCLGASKMGRPVYEKNGFKETEVWMEKEIK